MKETAFPTENLPVKKRPLPIKYDRLARLEKRHLQSFIEGSVNIPKQLSTVEFEVDNPFEVIHENSSLSSELETYVLIL